MQIPWSKPEVNDSALAQIKSAFDADWLTMGPKVVELEQALAERHAVPNAIAVTNGSIALDIMLTAYGIGAGDEVLVPALTYFATAASVARVGATPVFVDICEDDLGLNPDLIKDSLSEKTKAVLYIDHGGIPAKSDEIRLACEEFGLLCIQDAAQSLGGRYKGSALGVQTETSTMSFHMAKILSTVEGGVIFTKNPEIAHRLRCIRNQGETSKYVHTFLGVNGRMTDITAAIGLDQLQKLDHFLHRRRQIFESYEEALSGVPSLKIVKNNKNDAEQANFLMSILIENRDKLAADLKAKHIDTRICYPRPLQLEGAFEGRLAPHQKRTPIAASTAQKILCLPMYPSMTDTEFDYVVDNIISAVSNV